MITDWPKESDYMTLHKTTHYVIKCLNGGGGGGGQTLPTPLKNFGIALKKMEKTRQAHKGISVKMP